MGLGYSRVRDRSSEDEACKIVSVSDWHRREPTQLRYAKRSKTAKLQALPAPKTQAPLKFRMPRPITVKVVKVRDEKTKKLVPQVTPLTLFGEKIGVRRTRLGWSLKTIATQAWLNNDDHKAELRLRELESGYPESPPERHEVVAIAYALGLDPLRLLELVTTGVY